MSILFALCTLWLTPNTLSESAIASLEQVLTTFLPLFCCNPWPFCFPDSHRLSLGICSHLWSPSGCQALTSWYLFQVTLRIWAGMLMVHWEITLKVLLLLILLIVIINNSATLAGHSSVFLVLTFPVGSPVFIYGFLDYYCTPILFLSIPSPILLSFVFRVLLSSLHQSSQISHSYLY